MPNKLPEKVEDFVAPWETKTDDGKIEVGEIDPAKLKVLLFNAQTAERKAQADLAEANKAKKTVEDELKTLKQKNETDEERRTREAAESTSKATADAEAAGKEKLRADRLEVALEKGLTIAQANRLAGSTKDELLTDADAYIAENGIGEGEGDGDGDQGVSSRSPVGRKPKAPNDPNPQGDGASDPEAWAAEVNSDFIL